MADSPRPIQTLADLIPDDRNPNLGTARGHAMLRDSLQKFGAGRSILVDKHGKIIAGNKTAMEAFAAGLEEVVVVQTRGDKLVIVQREDLDLDEDERARLLSIADNRASEVGLEWDTAMLAQLAENDAYDFSWLFYDDELAALGTQHDAPAPDDWKEFDDDIETEYRCPSCGYEWSGRPK